MSITIGQALYDIGAVVATQSTQYPYQIVCPFHKGGRETSPSARVYPADNSIYCWVCHRSYNPIAVYSQFYGITYPSAIVKISERYGSVKASHYKNRDSKLSYLLTELVMAFELKHNNIGIGELDLILARASRGDNSVVLAEDIKALLNQMFPRLVTVPKER